MNNKKGSSGRQKIPFQKIPKKSNLQVTFSKRRSGLFKKASELCTLCGVEIAMIVFSPANKAFSFGHPEVESIIDRFAKKSSKNVDLSTSSSITANSSVNRNSNICNLNMQLTQILNIVEMEKKKGEELDRTRKVRGREFWWENPIDEIDSVDKLQELRISMEELKKSILKQKSFVSYSSSLSQISNINVGGDYYNGGSFFGRYDDNDDDVFDNKILFLGGGGAQNNINNVAAAGNNYSSNVIPDDQYAFNNIVYQNHDMGMYKFTSHF